ncbi:hypothetical protein VaNZ11_014973 [Volvox africanus]|uniref:Retrotransposon gag domain-containing protein n=1 Tax=Volvox africanus TaxID=51714 RepID=A0ABQ5SKN8_9CHLO|nr:hypothetical protein VaNZ11_014973 [Volvox africanus]
MMAGRDDPSFVGLACQPEPDTVPRMFDRDSETIDTITAQDPLVFQAPIHLTTPHLAALTVTDGIADQRGLLSPQMQDRANGNEVKWFTIPAPKLFTLHDMNVERDIVNATHFYLRDIWKYLQLVRGGDHDEVRCLFVGNTLEGIARTWYDQWITARENITFDELIVALLAHFIPQVT